ncbi:hypothetical protein KJS94_14405 [Flavihumibacter rivuli]|uniref:hypothetical protein n=1 Tax=Flavihumibacter rivuli TaxID=2838156 RepID=UPI001BDDD75B|nr:hypothetical protein [Flavihumibacter rivuli]ULQ55838.1 hypothetical protein KJS94_14405 [Flavihumibacter rivuli]
MKLEYLSDIGDDGKYKDVVSENLIRLYNFGQKETTMLVNLIYQRLILDKQNLDLTTADFIQSINCHVTLQLSSNDEGVIKTEKEDTFICKLTEQSYNTIIEYMKAAADSGHNWLCDTSIDNIDFLYSAGGTW